MPEISQHELNTLVEAKKLLDGIYADPEHGNAVKQAVHKHRPDIMIPELQAQAAIQPFAAKVDEVGAALAKLNERMDAEAQERQTAAAADALARKMANARDRFKLTDEGVEGMTALMREKGIVDPVDAAELYVARQPKPQIASQRTGRYGSTTYADVTGMADDADMQKRLLEDSDRFLVEETERCLGEFQAAGELV